MKAAFEAALGVPAGSIKTTYTRVQLWGAANPLTAAGVPAVFDSQSRTGACGDWCEGPPSVQAAAKSALALADAIEAVFAPNAAKHPGAAAALDAATVRWAPCSGGAAALGAFPGTRGVPAMAEVAAAPGGGGGGRGGGGRGGRGNRSRSSSPKRGRGGGGGGGGRGRGGGERAGEGGGRGAQGGRQRQGRGADGDGSGGGSGGGSGRASVSVAAAAGGGGGGSGRDAFASRGSGRVQGGALGGGRGRGARSGGAAGRAGGAAAVLFG
jgi:hypothetical protein